MMENAFILQKLGDYIYKILVLSRLKQTMCAFLIPTLTHLFCTKNISLFSAISLSVVQCTYTYRYIPTQTRFSFLPF